MPLCLTATQLTISDTAKTLPYATKSNQKLTCATDKVITPPLDQKRPASILHPKTRSHLTRKGKEKSL